MNSKKKKYYPVFVIIILFLLGKTIDVFTNISNLSLGLSMLPVFILLLLDKFIWKIESLFCFFILWEVFCIPSLLLTYNPYYFRVIIFQTCVLAFVFLSCQCVCNEYIFRRVQKLICYMVLAILIFDIVLRGRLQSSFLIFGLSYFVFSFFKVKALALLILSAGFFLLGARSSIIMSLCVYLFYKVIRKVRYSKTRYSMFFWVIIGITFVWPKIYIWIYQSKYSGWLNDLSRKLFHKNFFSGRNTLWIMIEEWIESNNKIVGIGGEFVGGTYAKELGVSTHNLFMFLRGQGGWILLILFIFLMYSVYMNYFRQIDNEYMAIAAAFLLGLLIRTDFDLILMANRFVDSMFMWLSICISICYCNYLCNVKKYCYIQINNKSPMH